MFQGKVSSPQNDEEKKRANIVDHSYQKKEKSEHKFRFGTGKSDPPNRENWLCFSSPAIPTISRWAW